MHKVIRSLVSSVLVVVAAGTALAQTGPHERAAPPEGYDTRRDGIDHGRLELVEYDSTTVGIPRKARVYTPPDTHRTGSTPSCICFTGLAETKTNGSAAALPTQSSTICTPRCRRFR